MADQFGSGPHLDGDFDFAAGPTGDLKIDSGVTELQKDLAFQMVINLQQYLGSPPGGNLEAQVAGTARRVAELDSRVLSVLSEFTEVSFSPDRKEITIEMAVETAEGPQDLIFEV